MKATQAAGEVMGELAKAAGADKGRLAALAHEFNTAIQVGGVGGGRGACYAACLLTPRP